MCVVNFVAAKAFDEYFYGDESGMLSHRGQVLQSFFFLIPQVLEGP